MDQAFEIFIEYEQIMDSQRETIQLLQELVKQLDRRKHKFETSNK